MKAVIFLLVLYLFFEVGWVGNTIIRAQGVISNAEKFERSGALKAPRVLVVGDSTGVGVGAAVSEESVAGRLGVSYPHVTVENKSISGLKTSGLVSVLESIPKSESYNLILIQIGGNDILNFVSLKNTEDNLRAIFKKVKEHSNQVVVMSTGNVGTAPGFGPVLSYVYSQRTLQVRDVFLKLSKEYDVLYVDMYREKENDVFAQEPHIYHAADGVHPSSKGYGEWYKTLERVIVENKIGI